MSEQKKADRKEYYRQQKKAYRAKHRAVSVSFTKDVAKGLECDAAKHHLSLPKYIKACVEAYRNQTFIVPDKSQVQSIELQLKGISNNINQIARRVNQGRTVPSDGVEQVRSQLILLEKQFNGIIRSPWNLETYISHCLKSDPNIATILLRILTLHNNAYQKTVSQKSVFSDPVTSVHD